MSDLYVGKSKLFFVLGLHRSGSSATAGVLHHLGANMGDDLLPPSLCNIRGFFENVHFVNLNDEILRTAGGSWDSPLNSKCIRDTKDSFDTEIRELISSQLKPVWGVRTHGFSLRSNCGDHISRQLRISLTSSFIGHLHHPSYLWQIGMD